MSTLPPPSDDREPPGRDGPGASGPGPGDASDPSPHDDVPTRPRHPPDGRPEGAPSRFADSGRTGDHGSAGLDGHRFGDDDPLVVTGFASWLRRVTEVSRRDFSQLAVLQVPVAVVSAAAGIVQSALLPGTAGLGGVLTGPNATTAQLGEMLGKAMPVELPLWLVATVVGAIVQAAGLFLVIRNAVGRPTTSADALRFTVGRAGPIIGWSLLGAVLTMIGLMLFVVPGVVLAVVFGGALIGVVVVERAGIRRCVELVGPRFGPTFGRLAVTFVAVGTYQLIVGAIGTRIAGAGTATSSILQAVLAIPAGVVGTAVIVVTFVELRWREMPTVFTGGIDAEMTRL